MKIPSLTKKNRWSTFEEELEQQFKGCAKTAGNLGAFSA
jgi:hypothetical protein